MARVSNEVKDQEAQDAPVYVDITIDLPPFTSTILLDGRELQQGMTYKFRQEQAASIKDIIARAWRHEQEVRGERKPFDPMRRFNGAMR